MAKAHITFDFTEEDSQPAGPPVPPQKSVGGRKKRSEDPPPDPIEVPEDDVLFARAYWAIGEVAEMFKVNVSLIRHWEKEFDILVPMKNRKGDRFFRPADVKNLQLIHDLVRRRRFTLEGAKAFMAKNARAGAAHELIASLQKIRVFLLEVKANL